MKIHPDDSPFDTLVAAFDGDGHVENVRRAARHAEPIQNAGYEVEIELVGPPTAECQPVGVYMRQTDAEQWRVAKRQQLAERIGRQIRDACEGVSDLASQVESLVTWATAHILNDTDIDYWRQVRHISYVDCRRWVNVITRTAQ